MVRSQVGQARLEALEPGQDGGLLGRERLNVFGQESGRHRQADGGRLRLTRDPGQGARDRRVEFDLLGGASSGADEVNGRSSTSQRRPTAAT
jgi:hypothetical protein